eukprot:jgi/Ulvmu1/9743/UM055_0083.1
MQSAVAALLLAKLAFIGPLTVAQPTAASRSCQVSDGPGPAKDRPDTSEVVDTPEQLQNAVSSGTRYIFITADLDLRTLPVATTELDCGVLKATTTAVIQGWCNNSGKQLPPHVHPMACTLRFHEDLLATAMPAAGVVPARDAGRLLLSQLHLLQEPLEAMPPAAHATAIHANGSNLFLTDVVLQASPAAPAARALDVRRQRNLLMRRGAILGFHEARGGAAVRVNVSASAAFHDVTFDGNHLTAALGDKANGPIAKLCKDSAASFSGCTFLNTEAAGKLVPLEQLFAVDQSAAVYVDGAQAQVYDTTTFSVMRSDPVPPGVTFLTEDDKWLRDIEEAAQKLRAQALASSVTAASAGGSDGLKIALAVCAAVLGIVLLVVLGILVSRMLRRRKQQQHKIKQPNGNNSETHGVHESAAPPGEYCNHAPPTSLPHEQVHAYDPHMQPWSHPQHGPPGYIHPAGAAVPAPPVHVIKAPPEPLDDPRHGGWQFAAGSTGLSSSPSGAISASELPASAAAAAIYQATAYGPGVPNSAGNHPAFDDPAATMPSPPLARLRVPPADPSPQHNGDGEWRPAPTPDRRSHRVHTPPSSGGHQLSPLAMDPSDAPAAAGHLQLGGAPVASQPEATLALALDYYANSRAPFLDRYIITGAGDRRMGGQGVVQFARDASTQELYAIKFFTRRAGFERERALYDKPALRSMMPAVIDVVPNADGRYATPAGFVFPPCIVVEKGESLDEWATRIEPGFPTILNVLCDVATRLQQLHAAGFVHRDLKPGNILWRPQHHSWTLIDFGCAAATGSSVGLSFSLLYAPPEVIHAVERQERQVNADPAIDMWAIGVIAYELLTRARVFPPKLSRSDVRNQIAGRAPLPWEDPEQRTEGLKHLRILKRTVLACLSRDPKGRPTADRLLRSWNRLFDTFTSGSGAVGANTNDLAGRQAQEPPPPDPAAGAVS